MTAKFEQLAFHQPVIVLTPEYGIEDILLAAFLRFDSNVIHASVERHENGRIKSIELRAEGGE